VGGNLLTHMLATLMGNIIQLEHKYFHPDAFKDAYKNTTVKQRPLC